MYNVCLWAKASCVYACCARTRACECMYKEIYKIKKCICIICVQVLLAFVDMGVCTMVCVVCTQENNVYVTARILCDVSNKLNCVYECWSSGVCIGGTKVGGMQVCKSRGKFNVGCL